MTIICGNAAEVLETLDDDSFGAVITDPPYGLGFMGKAWDASVPTSAVWRELRRVLRPGGVLMAFGGTKTFHRLAVSLEDGGWTLEDTILWLFAHRKPSSSGRLKPGWEPILIASACGAPLRLDVDAGRVPAPAGDREDYGIDGGEDAGRHRNTYQSWDAERTPYSRPEAGRWPMNAAVDGEIAELLGDKGRYFYCGRASKAERGEGNTHPTVKPVELMRWLVRLSGAQSVLDPFAGSGTTGVACAAEGVEFTGIELDPKYAAIAQERLHCA